MCVALVALEELHSWVKAVNVAAQVCDRVVQCPRVANTKEVREAWPVVRQKFPTKRPSSGERWLGWAPMMRWVGAQQERIAPHDACNVFRTPVEEAIWHAVQALES
jgi:hypothetical protein